MPSHNIKGPKNKLLDTEAHNSVSAVVRANANNWLVNTKALVNKEKSIANQYKIQSATPTFEGKKGFNGLNASDVEAHKNVGVNDQYYNGEVPKMSLVPEIKPVEINTGNASYTSNLGDELISLDRGIQYQTIGHGAGYVEPVDAENIVTTESQNIISDAAAELAMAQLNDASSFEIAALEGQLQSLTENLDPGTKKYIVDHEGRNSVQELGYQNAIKAKNLKEQERVEHMTSLEKALQNDKYLGTSGLDAVHAGDDTWEDADGNLTNNQTVIKETKEKTERALALQKDPHLVADEKLIATATRIKEEKEEKARRFAEAKAEAKANADKKMEQEQLERDVKENAESTPLGESQNERLKDIKRKEKYQDQAKSTPIGQGVAQREGELQRKLKREREEKAAEQRAAHDQYQNDKIDNIANESDKNWSNWRKMMKEQEALLNQGSGGRKARGKNEYGFTKHSKTLRVNDDPYAFSTLSYPSNLTQNNENGHYMLFYVNAQNQTKYEYEGLDSEHKKVMVGDMVEVPGHYTGMQTDVAPSERSSKPATYHKTTSAKSGDHLRADYQKQIIKNGGPGNILYNNMTILRKSRKGPLTGINSRFQTTTRITDSVALYLPPSINDNLSAQYGDSVTGMAGYLALSGVDLVQQIKDHDFAGAASTLFDSGGAIVEEAAKKLAAGAFETFTGSEGIRETFDKAFGQTLNPYIEVTYSSFGLRTFDYTFKFAPKSEKETDEVQAIINLFRFHMAPELKNTHHRYMTLPSTFDIHYMWQSGAGDKATAEENSFYNKIATCVLQSCNVDYTPNAQVQSFGDGAPTQINMTLSFKETEMLTKDKIAQGF